MVGSAVARVRIVETGRGSPRDQDALTFASESHGGEFDRRIGGPRCTTHANHKADYHRQYVPTEPVSTQTPESL